MFKRYIFFILMVMCSALGAEVNVSLNRKSVRINESFSAQFSSQAGVSQQPDFSPLENDFDILSQGQSQNISIINGRMTQQYQWSLTLMAKREGTLTIPSITFGNDRSEPQTIEVTAPKTSDHQETIFLEASLSPSTHVYEQAQLIYTIKLYCAVSLAQGALSEIEASDKDAIIDRLGNDNQYDQYDDKGNQYRVIERKYSVIPQHAGELVFTPILFQGKVVTGRSSFFDVPTEFIRASSNEVKVEVKPIPAPFNRSNWFPANNVKLSEEWSADPETMKLGEPITWTLTVKAEGIPGAQIPSIPLQFPADVKHYLDKPQVETRQEAQGTVGTKQFKVALIASKPGKITLPEIIIKWWDLKEDKLKETRLPSRILDVQGSQVAMNENLDDQPKKAAVDSKAEEDSILTNEESFGWIWGVLGLSCLALGGVYFVVSKRNASKSEKADSLRQIKSRLRKACMAHDAKQAEELLLAWGEQVFPDLKPLNMTIIKNYLPETIQEAITDLNRALYSQKGEWDGMVLWKAIDNFKPKHPHSNKGAGLLRKLYP